MVGQLTIPRRPRSASRPFTFSAMVGQFLLSVGMAYHIYLSIANEFFLLSLFHRIPSIGRQIVLKEDKKYVKASVAMVNVSSSSQVYLHVLKFQYISCPLSVHFPVHEHFQGAAEIQESGWW